MSSLDAPHNTTRARAPHIPRVGRRVGPRVGAGVCCCWRARSSLALPCGFRGRVEAVSCQGDSAGGWDCTRATGGSERFGYKSGWEREEYAPSQVRTGAVVVEGHGRLGWGGGGAVMMIVVVGMGRGDRPGWVQQEQEDDAQREEGGKGGRSPPP